MIDNEVTWIEPFGGLGDMLMLSGVLKLCHEQKMDRIFYMMRRTRYREFFDGHIAIKGFGNPPVDSHVITSNYWAKEALGPETQRPFQIHARALGLKTPIKEELHFPKPIDNEDIIFNYIPFKKDKTVIIAPYSDSPRKMLPLMTWEIVTTELKKMGFEVIQLGIQRDIHIRGAYSLLGVTTPQQVIAVLAKSDYVITVDNFIMHASHLFKKPAIALWGPTKPAVYGYDEQYHITSPVIGQCLLKDKCIGHGLGHQYDTQCSEKEHCMEHITPQMILEKFNNLI